MTYTARVTIATKNVLTATDPNDFIMRDDLNTFKILAEGTYAPTVAHNGTTETFTTASVPVGSSPFAIAFCKFENGRVGPVGTKASNANFWFTNLVSDGGQLHFYYINDTGGNYSPNFRYILCEVPTS